MKKTYTIKPVFTPVKAKRQEISRHENERDIQDRAHSAKELFHPRACNTYLRAENEDDDGYDPYSDRREEPPQFEPDPWN